MTIITKQKSLTDVTMMVRMTDTSHRGSTIDVTLSGTGDSEIEAKLKLNKAIEMLIEDIKRTKDECDSF